MGNYLLYNGVFRKNSEPLIGADNRGLRYGDGLFETLRVTGAQIHLLEWHLERLFGGLHLLMFEIPVYFTPAYISGQVAALCQKNQHNFARVRINIFRGNGGLYDTENHFPNCIIQSWALDYNDFRLNENGLVTGIYPDARKLPGKFSAIKSNNYLPYSMAALHAKKYRWNDALLLNSEGMICDATIANVFIVKNEIVYTPCLQDGCVAGIMRRFLIENLPLHGFQVQEKKISVEEILSADEVFLTNVIKGIRWISNCGETTYTNRLTTSICNNLLKK